MMLFVVGCTGSHQQPEQANKPVAAYQLTYDADTNNLAIKSIDVSPRHAGQNITGLAGVFQSGSTVFSGSMVTASVYIVNNSISPWTGVEMQAYSIISGSPTGADPDLGTGWYVDSPAYGAWGWLFTSDTTGSDFTIPAGGQSVNKVIGFDATSSFVAWVYIYADVPVISSITPTTAWSGATVTISGYNFGSTLSQVTFSGTTATVWTWTNSAVTITMPAVSGENVTGNVIINTTDTNTPYSNPITFTANKTNTYTVVASPNGIAIDSAGDVWVVNEGGNNVTELSPTGATIGTYAVGTNPLRIAIDSVGNVWVVNDSGNTVTELSPTGTTIGTYAVGTNPHGIAIDGAGNIWVTNYGDNTVTELSPTGTTITTVTVGTNPIGIAIDSTGDVWVANYGSNYVTELSPTGATIGTPSVYGPDGIVIDSSGDVWVSNLNGITELSPTGATIGTYVVGTNPHGIAIDSAGDVWVANYGSNNVTELSPTGVTIGTFAVGTNPIGIAIDSSGDVWVANFNSNKVTEIISITAGPQYFPYTGPQFPGGGNL